jgi:hypothetical protein
MHEVTVRDSAGEALNRWVVETSKRVAYITDAQGVDEVKQLGTTTRLVGFPYADIFLRKQGDSINDGDTPNWEEMEQWRPE